MNSYKSHLISINRPEEVVKATGIIVTV